MLQLLRIWALFQKLPSPQSTLSKTYAAGKLPSRPAGAGSAIIVIQDPKPDSSSAVCSPIIEADVFRIGSVRAMVDSGAKNSVICQELLSGRSSFVIRPSPSYRNIDGSSVVNVIGETSLTVRYQRVVVNLEHVVVVRSIMYSLVLGVEWIVKSGAAVVGVQGRAEVVMPGQAATSSTDSISPGGEKEKETAAVPVHGEGPGRPEEAQEFAKAAEELRVLGAMIGETEEFGVHPKRKFLKPMRSKRIPPPEV